MGIGVKNQYDWLLKYNDKESLALEMFASVICCCNRHNNPGSSVTG